MNDDVDLVVGSHNEVRFGKKPHLENVTEYKADEIDDRFIKFDEVVWWPWGKLFRRIIIEENNLIYDTNITFSDDHIFNLLYAKHMKGKTVVTDKIVYNNHYIRGGLCSRFYQNMDELQKYVYLKIADYFDGLENIPRKHHKYYVSCYMKGCMNCYIAWLLFNKAKKVLNKILIHMQIYLMMKFYMNILQINNLI